ncbi:Ser/Thr phosphatase family superfamily protein [Acanthamoeba castellanii str. Neff]|uniref:Ser/Thr phosphatase family superfamily protein n=1 Tax=Acanthamoeba castellanii (strain ATCC 30010 / Neff) TaxID=1257118 RepID=L8GX89_ACACF|nr:Ser/Thr phosphatase family superfamily protein [Acanthamoeba castellanii str. Neff]ELR17178.1 Ser/Thr phosphatase family superfamily protein [Acanthamoeba castellanii str. Neff]
MEVEQESVAEPTEGVQQSSEEATTTSLAPEVVTDPNTGLKVVIIGCCHGELDAMYESIVFLEQKQNIKIDLVLCCGDFQAVRNMTDLNALACPVKYREINTFYKYYSGEKVAPVMTIFIGGNHEASNHLTELYYGGWVAPNIYFLGMSGVVNFGGLRIGGLSGIWKKFDYKQGHYEMPPYSNDTMRSVYHVREFEVFKLKQLTQRLDVMLSHDWPRGIAHYGDLRRLLRAKPFLQGEIESGVFGSPPAEELLNLLQPDYWFSAHMHVKFPAVVQHASGQVTKFLALDKVWEFPEAKGPRELAYDEEWLAIVKSTNHLLSFRRGTVHMPTPHSSQRFDYWPTQEEREWIRERVAAKKDGLRVPLNFTQTAPVYTPGERGKQAGVLCESPQRTTFLELLDLPDLFLAYDPAAASLPSDHQHHQPQPQPGGPPPPLHHHHHPVAVSLLPLGLTVGHLPTATPLLFSSAPAHAKNEEEIDLSFDGDDEVDAGDVAAKRQRVGDHHQEKNNEEEINLYLDGAI